MVCRKILFLLPNFEVGGAERVLITLANNLDNTRFVSHLAVLNGQGPLCSYVSDRVQLHDFRTGKVSLSAWSLYRLIKREKPDVIVSTLVHLNGLAIVIGRLQPGIKIIIRESGMPSVLISEAGWKAYACRAIYKYLYPMADIILSPSRHVTAQLSKIGPSEKIIRRFYNPVDVKFIREKYKNNYDLQQSGSNSETFRFLCVGRLNREKGFDRLIEALRDFNSPVPWRLDIVGDGEEKEALTNLIFQNKLQDKIFLSGYTSNPWVAMAQADMLLLPSRSEGMPNVVLEALACGLPILALAQAGGVDEIAQLCQDKQSVKIVPSMSDFIQIMKECKFTLRDKERASLLPPEFLLENVMRKFEDLLL